MKKSIVVKATPTPNQFTNIYTVPTNVLYATISINIVNTSSTDAKVTMAISKLNIPAEYDYIDYNLPIGKNGDQLCRQGFIMSAGESLILIYDNAGVVIRVTGVVETIDIAQLIDYSYYPNDSSKRISVFYLSDLNQGVDFNVTAKNLLSATPIVQFSKISNFSQLENINATLQNYDSTKNTMDIHPFFKSAGMYYMRVSNDGIDWSNVLSFNIVDAPTLNPVISALPNCNLVPDGYMLNSGPASGVNGGFIINTYVISYIAVDFSVTTMQVLVSTDINFNPNTTINCSDYDINDNSKYYLKLDPSKTYYVKASNIANSQAYDSNIFTFKACK